MFLKRSKVQLNHYEVKLVSHESGRTVASPFTNTRLGIVLGQATQAQIAQPNVSLEYTQNGQVIDLGGSQ